MGRHTDRRRAAALIVVLTSLAAASCEKPVEPPIGSSTPPFVESGDLQQIERRGVLRVLRPRLAQAQHLPRQGEAFDVEEELVEAYARSTGLSPFWVYVETRDKLIPALLEGRGDFIAANLTVTERRRGQVEFTVPVAIVREQLVTRADDERIRDVEDLAGRTVAVHRSSSFLATLKKLKQRHPGIRIREVSERLDVEEIIHRVGIGELDVTVADSNVVRAVLAYRDDVKPVLDLTQDRPIAWAVRPDATDLKASLDRFLTDAHIVDRSADPHTLDLDAIRERKVLRLLTRNNAASYFLYRGELVGFEYELAREFARQQGLRLEVIVPPSGKDLLPWLEQGRGDLVAAALTISDERRRDTVRFSRPYNLVEQVVVARANDPAPIAQISDLGGRTFVVRPSSPYMDTLLALKAAGTPIAILPAPEEMETEEIIARVAEGEYDLTLADSHILAIELSWRDDVRGAIPLTVETPLGWAVRDSNPRLLAAVNEFLDREYRGLFYNVLMQRYFEDSIRIRRRIVGRPQFGGRLSPYDDLVKRYAEQYGFDWRLVVSVMFQESRFDPAAVSFAGARGLLQVLPGTAEEFGIEPDAIHDPETGIHVGVRYLDWVRDRFESDLSVRDRMWFTLAAYNAGFGHVREARRLAARQGLNPNRWFGHVERAMLLLSRPEYALQSRYGYCRCHEPVNYVREIRARFDAYVESIGTEESQTQAYRREGPTSARPTTVALRAP